MLRREEHISRIVCTQNNKDYRCKQPHSGSLPHWLIRGDLPQDFWSSSEAIKTAKQTFLRLHNFAHSCVQPELPRLLPGHLKGDRNKFMKLLRQILKLKDHILTTLHIINFKSNVIEDCVDYDNFAHHKLWRDCAAAATDKLHNILMKLLILSGEMVQRSKDNLDFAVKITEETWSISFFNPRFRIGPAQKPDKWFRRVTVAIAHCLSNFLHCRYNYENGIAQDVAFNIRVPHHRTKVIILTRRGVRKTRITFDANYVEIIELWNSTNPITNYTQYKNAKATNQDRLIHMLVHWT